MSDTMNGFSITYEVVTQESAEYGDFKECGFLYEDLSLSDAVYKAINLGIYDNTGSDWFQSVDPDIDYQTGEETSYSLHYPRSTSNGTINRIKTLLNN